jgi:serine/threonine-protein kinase RsbW
LHRVATGSWCTVHATPVRRLIPRHGSRVRFSLARPGYHPAIRSCHEGAGIEEGNAVLATAGIHQRVPATADQVPRLRAAVLAFSDAHLDFGEATRSAVALAVTEACANVVAHAYPGAAGEIAVTARAEDHDLLVEIGDDGVGIHTSPASNGLGLGIPIMLALSDAHIAGGNGTTVELRFRRDAEPG